jgi:dihydroorotase
VQKGPYHRDEVTYDLVLKGATVIDPSQDLNGRYEVAVRGGRVAAVEKEILAPSKEIVELEGKILTPGWIDIHAHVYPGATTWGYHADAHCLSTGVTTIVDAGSAGWANFRGLLDYVMAPSRTQILAFVHVSGIGLTYGPLGELLDLRYADPERTAMVIRNWPDRCVGVKIRAGAPQLGEHGVKAIRLALRAAELSGTPLMAHMGQEFPLPDVLNELRAGDIATHCFHQKGDTILGDEEKVIPAAREARKRGVLFDLGHGGGSFTFAVAKQALAQGFPSDVISTDLHTGSLDDPVHSLPETASKMLHLGMGLEEVVRQTTAAPANAICRGDELGTLKVGTVADLAAFEIQEGSFKLTDVRDFVETGERMITPVLTVREGKVYRPGDLVEELAEGRERVEEMRSLMSGKSDGRL